MFSEHPSVSTGSNNTSRAKHRTTLWYHLLKTRRSKYEAPVCAVVHAECCGTLCPSAVCLFFLLQWNSCFKGSLFHLKVESLYTNIPHEGGLAALTFFFKDNSPITFPDNSVFLIRINRICVWNQIIFCLKSILCKVKVQLWVQLLPPIMQIYIWAIGKTIYEWHCLQSTFTGYFIHKNYFHIHVPITCC